MKTMCKICSNLTVKKSERLSNIVLVSSLLTLERAHTHSSDVSIVKFEKRSHT